MGRSAGIVSGSGAGGTPEGSRTPERRCVACGRRASQAELVRLRLDWYEETDSRPPRVVVDRESARSGRGAYICPRRVCLEQAVRRRAFQRAFRTAVTVDPAELARMLEERMGEAN